MIKQTIKAGQRYKIRVQYGYSSSAAEHNEKVRFSHDITPDLQKEWRSRCKFYPIPPK